MKCLPCEYIMAADKQLVFKMIVLMNLSVVACSNLKSKSSKTTPIKLSNMYKDTKTESFDRFYVPNRPPAIARMISVLKPRFSVAQRNKLAHKIHGALKKYQIPPQIVVAIIDTESNFNHKLVSSTGDLSLAQINVEVWNKEFARMKLELIDTERLIADEEYSLEIMAKILNVLKTRYEKNDRHWYARYHSKTMKYKKDYLTKLTSRMKLLERSERSQILAMN